MTGESLVNEDWKMVVKLRGSAKPRNHHRPVFVYKRFTSHPLLESRTIPTRKHKLNAYGEGRVSACTRGPRARKIARARVDHRYSGDTFPAQQFTAYTRSS